MPVSSIADTTIGNQMFAVSASASNIASGAGAVIWVHTGGTITIEDSVGNTATLTVVAGWTLPVKVHKVTAITTAVVYAIY
jgi:hypothetical protein